MPLPPPPKRHNLPLELGEGGGRIQSGTEKKGRGCNYHEMDDGDDENDDNSKGRKKGKSINDVFHSMSEYLPVTLFTLTLSYQ